MGKGPLETFLKSRHCEWPTGTRKDSQHHQTSGVSCVSHLGSPALVFWGLRQILYQLSYQGSSC